MKKTNEATCSNVTQLKICGIDISVDTSTLPGGGQGIDPGPDGTHLVSRGGQLVWEPIPPSGSGVNYSTEEQWTGRLWVDGKKIYQKTIEFGAMPLNTVKSIPLDISGFHRLIDAEGRSFSNERFQAQTFPDRVSSIFIDEGKTLSVRTSSEWGKHDEAYITLFYTCTDR